LAVAAQTSTPLKEMNEKSIMVDIGAKYNAQKTEWQFSPTDRYRKLFNR
jgi:hypothetical protein